MTSRVQSPKDFWTGLIYLAVGAGVIVIGRNYSVGTASRMGPGYFPLALAGLLIIFGVVAVVRSFLVPGEPIAPFAWKPLILVLIGTTLFGNLVGALGLVALIAFCSLVFVKGLGVPMPLFGPWLEPLLGPGIAG